MNKPVMARVRSVERAQEVLALLDAHGVKAVVGVEPEKPEDISEVERALAKRAAPDLAREGPKIGRNAPCPCGSGRKYKKCCGRNEIGDPETRPSKMPRLADDVREEIERLDRWSNGVLDEIEAGRFDRAEELCRKLAAHYPDTIDGPERLAMLRTAQGRWEEAVDEYDRALAIIAREPEEYDREMVAEFCRSRDDARRRAGLSSGKPLPPEIAAHIAPAPLRLVQNIVRKIREFRVK